MVIQLRRNPTGKGFIVTDGQSVIASSDRIEDARRAGMIEANRRGWLLISKVNDLPSIKRHTAAGL